MEIYDESGFAVGHVPCERKCEGCKNAAPEQIKRDVVVENAMHRMATDKDYLNGVSPSEAIHMARYILYLEKSLATAAMQPVPSESDEAVAREIVAACVDDTELGEDQFNLDEKVIAAILAKHRQPAAVSADAVDGGWYRIDEVTPPHEETVLLYTPATDFSPYEIEAGWASGGELITFPDGGQSISTRWWHGSATHWKPIGPLPAALSPETVCGGE